jgi:hypothetical protein
MLNQKSSLSSRFIKIGPVRWIFTAAWGILLGILIIIVLRIAFLQFFFKASADENPPSFQDHPDAASAPNAKDLIKRAAGTGPNLEIKEIIPYGRSLELIGLVDAGTRLSLNNERVEVLGDGSFKHFTRQFPKTSDTVLLELKATDLAGRTRTITRLYKFNPGDKSK